MTPKVKTFLERLFSTVVLLSLLGAAVGFNEPAGYAVLICLFCNLTTVEWHNMLRSRAETTSRPLALAAGLVYPWLMAAGVLFNDEWFNGLFQFAPVALGCLVFYALACFFCELIRMDYKGRTGAQALASVGTGLLAFVYPVWLFAFALVALGSEYAVYSLLWLILVTKMSDIWAYVCGVLTGGRFITRRFSPTVSPKKTWEGIIGSLIITTLVAWLISGMADFRAFLGQPGEFCGLAVYTSPVFFLVLMPALFVLSVAGDLAGSLIKRGLEVKDSGSLLPGIGGIFDLIDSPAFTVSFAVAVLGIL